MLSFYFVPRNMPNGSEFEFTFHLDFDIADHFGASAVKDTYRRALKCWKRNIKAVAELYIVLNERIWFWYRKGNEALARVYDELWRKLGAFVYDDKTKFSKEDLEYFFKMTD